MTDSVTATFANRSSETIYIFQGCPSVGLEQRAGGAWETVEIPIACAAVVRLPLPVEPGDPRTVGLAPWMLREAEVVPATYRLTLRIGPTEEDAPRTVVSNRFEGVE